MFNFAYVFKTADFLVSTLNYWENERTNERLDQRTFLKVWKWPFIDLFVMSDAVVGFRLLCSPTYRLSHCACLGFNVKAFFICFLLVHRALSNPSCSENNSKLNNGIPFFGFPDVVLNFDCHLGFLGDCLSVQYWKLPI